jgi:hypothetical protein
MLWVRDIPGIDGPVVHVIGHSRVEVRNSEFSKNGYTPLGVFDQAHLLLVASTIANNSDNRNGGGLYISGDANVTITGQSKLHGNNAAGKGGGVFVKGHAIVSVDGNNSVMGNTADSGGGLAVLDLACVVLKGGSSVVGNIAVINGGGLAVGDRANVLRLRLVTETYNNGSNVILTGGSIVMGNSADKEGGGLAVYDGGNVTLTNASSVQGNTAGTEGGGLYLHFATAILSGGSRVENNIANMTGGGLSLYGSNMTLTGGSRVHGNRALNGTGGGLRVLYNGRVTISNHSSVSNNSCLGGAGGGISVELQYITLAKFDGRGRAVAAGETITGLFTSVVSIDDSMVANNTSIGSAGGGLAVGINGTVELVNNTALVHNRALDSSGGGVVLIGNGKLHADDSVIVANNSVNKGYVGSTIATFDNSVLDLPHGGRLTKCSVGMYLGWSTCKAGETQLNDMCVCCPQHTFSFTNASCEACPLNGNCSGGSLVQPLPGYWSSAPTSVQMHRCPLSTTACNYTSPVHQCNEGYMGPLCGACMHHGNSHKFPWYGMLSPFRCGECFPPKVQLGLYLLISSACVVFATVTVYTTWRDNLKADRVVLATDNIKVLVLFLQYTVLIGSVSVNWPLLTDWQSAALVPGCEHRVCCGIRSGAVS